jgi:hypothetical protein
LYSVPAIIIVLVLGLMMYGGLKLGHFLGHAKVRPEKGGEALITALFGLLGFLLAFSFNMSQARFEMRRTHIAEETNAIGTALLRTDLLPDSVRAQIRVPFKAYVASRIAYFNAGHDPERVATTLQNANNHFAAIWAIAASFSRQHPEQVTVGNQLIPALTEMADAMATRHSGLMATVPDLIVYMLLCLCIAVSLFTGYYYGAKKTDNFVAVGFVALVCIVVYITLDLDRPRRGIITMKEIHQPLEQLSKGF